MKKALFVSQEVRREWIGRVYHASTVDRIRVFADIAPGIHSRESLVAAGNRVSGDRNPVLDLGDAGY